MNVFRHHVYEYKKGLRDLVLCVERRANRDEIERRLHAEQIPHVVQEIADGRINVFFGHAACIKVVSTFGPGGLAQLSDEQDFLLGIMLGYGRLQQCERYLERRARRRRRTTPGGDAADAEHLPERASPVAPGTAAEAEEGPERRPQGPA